MVLEDLFRRPSTLTRLRLPPLGPMMDGLCEWLGCRGTPRMEYAAGCGRCLISTVIFDDGPSKTFKT